MKSGNLRWLVIGVVISCCVMAGVMLVAEQQWGELITAVLGVAGFILTWEVTKQDDSA